MSITVLVCSPVPALRAGLRALLAADPGLEVAAASASLADAAAQEEGGLPADWLVVATPGGVDLEADDLLAGRALLLVADDPQEFVPGLAAGAALADLLAGLELRAWGVLAPGATGEALRAAVRALAEGLLVLSPELAGLLAAPAAGQELAGLDSGPEDEAPLERLTEREAEVLRQVARGLTNKQIAVALGISEHTVKFHVSSIYSKLGAANRSEAVRKGARAGWVPL